MADDPLRELDHDIRLLGRLLGETLAAREAPGSLPLIEGIRHASVALRAGALEGGRDAFAARFAGLGLDELELTAHAFTQLFHLINAAEEQHRIRVLRSRDREPAAPSGSVEAAVSELARAGVGASEVRAILSRLFVMPVLTAHPTEARRRTLLDHLAEVSAGLDRLDDPRPGVRERQSIESRLHEAVCALYCTDEARTVRPTPLDEVRAGLHVFERTLLEVTPRIYRALEGALARAWPGEPFEVGPFLKWGTWIGGDRDGNPNVTAEVTRAALERQRRLVLARHLEDVAALGQELSVSVRHLPPPPELVESLRADRDRLPEVAARVRRYHGEPWREKLLFMRARLNLARERGEAGYPDARSYLDDLDLLARSLTAPGTAPLTSGRLRDVRRRAEVFGFHLATMDLRQHSQVHEAAVAELLARGGIDGYRALDEEARARLLTGLLDRAGAAAPLDRTTLSPESRELLATLDVVGRARRDSGPEACERYVVSFTNAPSDLLEVLFLCRAARLSPGELKPVPLLEQLEDLAGAGRFAEQALELPPLAAAFGDELEVMVGYSDSGKQVGYLASTVALKRAQEALARVADRRGVTLTIFHGRGGAIGRGGGPAGRAIRAQPAEALRGRLRTTEQGETITARYGRLEIAERDLEQMIGAVLTSSLVEPAGSGAGRAREATLDRAAEVARRAYARLLEDRGRLVAYAIAATPIEEISELPLASRPTRRRPGLALEDLRAIPWVFSWAQSRHGLPGWFGLGAALEAVSADEGPGRVRELYREWPYFRALIDNAQVALVRADIEVAERYARLADPSARELFALIAEEHRRTVAHVLEATGARELLAAWPTIARTVERRNPSVDVLSHIQIELLARLRAAPPEARERIREILFITINGIAAGLQTAG